MLVLGIESSALAASAAVVEDGSLLGEYFVNIKQTHSQTLLPMVESLLRMVGRSCEEFDLMAAASGPGSFTGVRIGVSSVKGLAMPRETPCCGISTLEVIAYGGIALEGAVLCAVMDARCGQVYNGMFRVEKGKLVRLCEDRALSIETLSEEVRPYQDRLVLLGDGAALCHEAFSQWGARLAPEWMRFQRASSVAFLALEKAKENKAVSPADLQPSYLRLPQAERELKNRKK